VRAAQLGALACAGTSARDARAACSSKFFGLGPFF
jgi:hypothetical protein